MARHAFHSTWLGRIWNFLRAHLSLPIYFWAKCPRCDRYFGGHEGGGSQGCMTTCWRCPESIGWYPVGPGDAMRSRYFDGTQWVGDEIVGPSYSELNDHHVPSPKGGDA